MLGYRAGNLTAPAKEQAPGVDDGLDLGAGRAAA